MDEILVLGAGQMGGVGRIWAGIKLGVRGWDMIVIRFNSFSAETILAASAGRIRKRVGHCSSPEWHNRWDSILNVPVPMRCGTHEVDLYLQS